MKRKRTLMSRKGLVSQRKLAKVLGITPRWVRDLEVRGIFKKTFEKYDKDECVTAYIVFLRGSKDKSLAEAQRIHLETKTRKLLLEAEKLQGNLVDKDEEHKKTEFLVHQCEENFRNFPAKLVPILVRIDKTEEKLMFLILKHEIESCWRELAGVPKNETPVIHPGETILLVLGLIKPDSSGEVIELISKFPFTRRVKAADLVSHWKEVNEKYGRSPEGNTNSLGS